MAGTKKREDRNAARIPCSRSTLAQMWELKYDMKARSLASVVAAAADALEAKVR